MLSEWSLMHHRDGVALNYYGPSTFELELSPGRRVVLTQQTAYPLEGDITVTVDRD